MALFLCPNKDLSLGIYKGFFLIEINIAYDEKISTITRFAFLSVHPC